MTNRESYNREQFERAGEQAAHVLGRFMSIASGLSAEFNRNTDSSADGQYKPDQSADGNDVLREAGEQLQKMREAAGYTLDSFANALKSEIDQPDIAAVDVVTKVKAAESGKEPLPNDWLSQMSTLLGGDPVQFFEQLRNSDRAEASTKASAVGDSVPTSQQSTGSQRAKQFSALFENDADLESCTDEQFEKLLGFVEKNYKEAKNLVVGS